LRILSILTICLLMFAVRGADASDRKVKVTGVYSDLAYNHEGRDVLGTELFVVLSRLGYYVLFQSSEGKGGQGLNPSTASCGQRSGLGSKVM
jgi:hypothetical protein